MTDRTVNERQRRQTQRDRAAGLVKIAVKIPEARAAELRAIAAAMRGETPKPQDDTL